MPPRRSEGRAGPPGPPRATPLSNRRAQRSHPTFVLAALFACTGILRAEELPFRTVGLAANADVHTLAEALSAIPADNASPKIISIQAGAYFGHVVLDKPHVILRGSGPSTVLTSNLGQAMPGIDDQPVTWRGAATLHLTPAAHDVIIENLTIENTYGKGMQAQACSSEADRVTFRHCLILGWQDTMRLETGRLYFDRCYISGHVDFIYGGATAFFDRCTLFCRDQGYIVAPATPAGRIGFVFADCKIVFPYGNPLTYLGRPWHESPSATFVRCELGAGVRAEGWHEWHVKPPLVRFAEYQCTGPGAAVDKRVDWSTHSNEPAPAEFNRNAVLGDWNPIP